MLVARRPVVVPAVVGPVGVVVVLVGVILVRPPLISVLTGLVLGDVPAVVLGALQLVSAGLGVRCRCGDERCDKRTHHGRC